jgi:hypothetical protein
MSDSYELQHSVVFVSDVVDSQSALNRYLGNYGLCLSEDQR